MLRIPLFIVLVLALCPAGAQSLLKPLPEPDLTGLPADMVENLRRQRAEFEESRAALVGPQLAEAYGLIGGIYARSGVFAPAQVAFDNAMALVPDDFRMVYLGGLVAMLAEDLPAAQRLFERAMEIAPQYPATRVHLADVLVRQGQAAAAERHYREIIAEEDNAATAHARLGQLAMEQRRFEQARTHFADALKADPGATSLYVQLAAAERALGREEQATAIEARAGQGRLSLADPLARALFGPSAGALDGVLRLIAAGELEPARRMLGERVKTDPEDAMAKALLARVEAGLGNIPQAREWAREALQADRGMAAIEVAAGVVEEMAGDEARAIQHYTRAVSINGEHAEARLMLGDALMRRGDHAQAAQQYRVLAAQDGERARGLPRLVAAEAKAGRCAEALKAAAASREQQPRDGERADIWVRVAASCPAASDADRNLALEIATALYELMPDAQSSESAAMAHAALGQWDDAVDLQRQALFELAKSGDQDAIARGRALLEHIVEKKAADLPWPSGHPLYAPPRMQPVTP